MVNHYDESGILGHKGRNVLRVAQLVTHLPSTKATRDQSLAIALMARDLGEFACGVGCEYLFEKKIGF